LLAGQLGDGLVELRGWDGAVDQFDVRGFAPGQRLARERVLLGLGQPEAVDPHRAQVAAPHSRVGRADLGILGRNDEIGAERHVGPATDAPAVDLRNDRLRAGPQAHEVGHGRVEGVGHSDHVGARVPLRPFRVLRREVALCAEVEPGAEGASRALEHDDAYSGIAIRLADAGRQVLPHWRHDRVELFGPVQGERGDGVARVIEHQIGLHRGSLAL